MIAFVTFVAAVVASSPAEGMKSHRSHQEHIAAVDSYGGVNIMRHTAPDTSESVVGESVTRTSSISAKDEVIAVLPTMEFLTRKREALQLDPWYLNNLKLFWVTVATACLAAFSLALQRKGAIHGGTTTMVNVGCVLYALTLASESVLYFFIPVNVSTIMLFIQLAFALLFAKAITKEYLIWNVIIGIMICIVGTMVVHQSLPPRDVSYLLGDQKQAEFLASVVLVVFLLSFTEAFQTNYRLPRLQSSPLIAALFSTIAHFALNCFRSHSDTTVTTDTHDLYVPTVSSILAVTCFATAAAYVTTITALNSSHMVTQFLPAYTGWMALFGHIMMACATTGGSVISLSWVVGMLGVFGGLLLIVVFHSGRMHGGNGVKKVIWGNLLVGGISDVVR
eukprot:GEMP01030742.1.p1 GENE.GEMP01030742.1~~GEMP01030742.1.p1  ORF type:complete len:393 (+),score=77.67 GEMP01030742.1:280-1458(+)